MLHIQYSRCVIYTIVVQSLYESLMVAEMVQFPNYHVFSTLTLKSSCLKYRVNTDLFGEFHLSVCLCEGGL